MEHIEKYGNWYALLAVTVCIIGVFLSGYYAGQDSVVNNLCKKQQYEFCQVDRYVLKK